MSVEIDGSAGFPDIDEGIAQILLQDQQGLFICRTVESVCRKDGPAGNGVHGQFALVLEPAVHGGDGNGGLTFGQNGNAAIGVNLGDGFVGTGPGYVFVGGAGRNYLGLQVNETARIARGFGLVQFDSRRMHDLTVESQEGAHIVVTPFGVPPGDAILKVEMPVVGSVKLGTGSVAVLGKEGLGIDNLGVDLVIDIVRIRIVQAQFLCFAGHGMDGLLPLEYRGQEPAGGAFRRCSGDAVAIMNGIVFCSGESLPGRFSPALCEAVSGFFVFQQRMQITAVLGVVIVSG